MVLFFMVIAVPAGFESDVNTNSPAKSPPFVESPIPVNRNPVPAYHNQSSCRRPARQFRKRSVDIIFPVGTATAASATSFGSGWTVMSYHSVRRDSNYREFIGAAAGE